MDYEKWYTKYENKISYKIIFVYKKTLRPKKV